MAAFSWASELDPVLLSVYASLSICFIVIFCCVTMPLYLNERLQSQDLDLEGGLGQLPKKRKAA
jgi:hypothetical protein